jgi:glycerophosphoryl diester phosphodiesterase
MVAVLGHRGGRGEGWVAENTLDAFSRALEEGAQGVELDVRLCGSGDPVVLHDRTLARVTEGRDARGVHQVRLEDLPRLSSGGEKIPTLSEALDLFGADHVVNVEVKADVPSRREAVRVVANLLNQRRGSGPQIVVSSFDPAVVLGFARAAARIPRAMLIGHRTPRLSTALPRLMRRAAGIEAAHLEDGIITKERVDRLRASNLRVVAWTVNDAARAIALREMGVEMIITDHPKAIVDALRS